MDYNRLFRNGHPVEKDCFSSRHLGYGVFETFRARYRGNCWYIMKFNSHLERLKRGAAALNLPSPEIPALIATLKDALLESKEKDIRCRIVVYADSYELQLLSYKENLDFITETAAVYLPGRRNFPEYKHCSCLTSLEARATARKKGFQEAIFVDEKGIIREGAFSNIFFVLDNEHIVTPSGGILPGVTREFVLEERPVEEHQEIRPEAISEEIVEAFLTLSTAGIVPLSKLGTKKLSGARGRVVAGLTKSYEDMLFSSKNRII